LIATSSATLSNHSQNQENQADKGAEYGQQSQRPSPALEIKEERNKKQRNKGNCGYHNNRDADLHEPCIPKSESLTRHKMKDLGPSRNDPRFPLKISPI
jgi:hypothetical protein